MIIYLLELLIIITIAIVLHNFKFKKKNEIFMILCFIVLFSISALRASTVGTDTQSYINIFQRIINNYDSTHAEFGYIIFNEMTSIFSANSQAIIISTSLFVNFGVCLFIYKNSKKMWLSVILYITLYYYFFSFNYVRQYMAIVIVLNSLVLLKQNKYLWFIFLVGVASTIHTTALIGFAYAFFYYFSNNKKIILYIIFASLFMMLFSTEILDLFTIFFPRYNIYTDMYLERDGGIMIVLLYCSVFIAMFLFQPKQNDKSYNFLLSISAMSAVLSILGYGNFIFIRPALYFNIFTIVIIPNLIYRFIKNERPILSLIFVAFSTIYMLYYFNVNWHNILPYDLF